MWGKGGKLNWLISRSKDWMDCANLVLQLLKPDDSSIASSMSTLIDSSVSLPLSSPHLLSRANIPQPPPPVPLPLVAAVQMCSTNDKTSNLAKTKLFVTEAVRLGASFICLPECCCFMGHDSAETLANAEAIDGPYLSALALLANDNKVWISVGGFPLITQIAGGVGGGGESEEGCHRKVSNLHVVIDPEGKIRAEYKKIHLFDSPLAQLFESKNTVAGSQVSIVPDSPLGIVGLTICYDLRFPELFSKLCRPSDAGGLAADVVLVPSAFTAKTGEAHWEVLLRSRAIENQVYVVAAAQCGQHNPRRRSHGHTIIIDPWGRILAECDGEKEGFCMAPINLSLLEKIREEMPVMMHRRPDTY